jgi:hypothetical protein
MLRKLDGSTLGLGSIGETGSIDCVGRRRTRRADASTLGFNAPAIDSAAPDRRRTDSPFIRNRLAGFVR